MNPENAPISPNFGPEHNRGFEYQNSPEVSSDGVRNGAEQASSAVERDTAKAYAEPSSIFNPVNPINNNQSNTQTADDAQFSSPTIAKDDDLIEPEWVQSAKKIIDNTKGSPYDREEQASKLQIEYLKKRYGKDLRKPD